MIVLVSDVNFTFYFHLFPGLYLKFTLCTTPLHCSLLPGDGSKPHKARHVLASSWSHWGSSQGLSVIQSSDQTIVFQLHIMVTGGLCEDHPVPQNGGGKASKTGNSLQNQLLQNRKNHHIFNDRPLETERVIVTSLRRSSGRYQKNAMFFS